MKVSPVYKTLTSVCLLLANNIWTSYSKQIDQHQHYNTHQHQHHDQHYQYYDIFSPLLVPLDDPEEFLLSWLQHPAEETAGVTTTSREQQEDQQHNHRHRNLQGIKSNPPDIQVVECSDATDYFSWRGFNNINVFKTYYDCQCSGDLSSEEFTMVCSLENHCFTDDANSNSNSSNAEQCVTRKFTFDFTVDPTSKNIDKIERGLACTEYLTNNGPITGPLCNVMSGVCSVRMLNDHDYTTEESIEICSDTRTSSSTINATCEETLAKLGYTQDRVDDLCQRTTLNGQECKSAGMTPCAANEDIDGDFYLTTPDCSNVESCATSSCQLYPSPRGPKLFVPTYSQCHDSSTSSGTHGHGATVGVHIFLINLVALQLYFHW